ncbi:MAG TPA: hypothetical protein VD932_01825, partial [Aquabacterium sp.]|nr:hypothetical protein [Aquabacterium sp.]
MPEVDVDGVAARRWGAGGTTGAGAACWVAGGVRRRVELVTVEDPPVAGATPGVPTEPAPGPKLPVLLVAAPAPA